MEDMPFNGQLYLNVDDVLKEEDLIKDIEITLLDRLEWAPDDSFEEGLEEYIEWVQELADKALEELESGDVVLYDKRYR